MKRIVTTLFGVVCLLQLSFAVKKTISTVGTAFSPTSTEMNVGDTIVFNVDGGHTATEVTQGTWNANGTTPSGIFNLSPGNNQMVTGLTVGTHYFVCQVHVGSMAMKGTILVNSLSPTKQNILEQIRIFPNPSNSMIQLENAGKDLRRVTLTGTDGRTIRNWSVDAQNTSLLVDDVPTGVYFLSGYSDRQQLWIEKFQKQ